MNELITPYAQIRSNSIVLYNKFTGSKKKSVLVQASQRLRESVKYSGEVTAGASKRMSKAINLLIESSEKKRIFNPVSGKNMTFQLAFVTLTIPDLKTISTKDAHKNLLEPLLKWLRQVHGMKNYVWKLEVQKRGVIHYHLTCDSFVVHSDLRKKWNYLLTKNNLNESYVADKGHTDANSTDIHSVKNIRDLASYLIKYFTKKEQNQTGLTGKIWDCSKNLKTAKYYETELTEDINADIFEAAYKNKWEVFESDTFSIIKVKGVKPISLFPAQVKEAYYLNLKNIRELPADLFHRPKIRNKKQDTVVIPIQNNNVPKFEYIQGILNFYASNSVFCSN